MHKAIDKIKKSWEENPLGVITVASSLVIASAKLLDSLNGARNSRAWKKEVERRRMKQQGKY